MNRDELEVVLKDHSKWLKDSTDLRFADLSSADLRFADLRFADLRFADLRFADLRFADLRFADLRFANLSFANLSDADFSDADLSDAKQKIILITGSRHSIYAIDNDIRIGCQRQSLEDWLKNYKDVGEKEGYTSEQIREYGLYLKAIAEILENKGK